MFLCGVSTEVSLFLALCAFQVRYQLICSFPLSGNSIDRLWILTSNATRLSPLKPQQIRSLIPCFSHHPGTGSDGKNVTRLIKEVMSPNNTKPSKSQLSRLPMLYYDLVTFFGVC